MSSPGMSSVDAHLEMDPEDAIVFPLSLSGASATAGGAAVTTPGGTGAGSNDSTPRVTLTLRHPDADSPPVAFKVKTTQPRRYLVRPNQGLIAPGGTETVQILLVEKDTKQLIAAYEQLGVAALEHCKDKFLVQSVAVSALQAQQLGEYEQLTAFWASTGAAAATTAQAAIVNKKLHVRHVIVDATGAVAEGDINVNATTTTRTTMATTNSSTTSTTIAPTAMTKEQLIPELTGLRRKYDELVAFSVNLTAERDMLSNTLEQTRRDLNRAVNARNSNSTSTSTTAASPNKSALNARSKADVPRRGFSMLFVLFWSLVCLGLGLYVHPFVVEHQSQLDMVWELIGYPATPPAPRRRVVKQEKEL